MANIRVLRPGDETALEAFLLPRKEFSMFLLGNLRASGLIDRGQPYQGTYVATFDEDHITGVVAHYWNGILIPQAPSHLDALWQVAVRTSCRYLQGFNGPRDQVTMVLQSLGLGEANIQLDEAEKLYSLDLERLKEPEQLRSGKVCGRRIQHRDVELITRWRIAYSIETLAERDTPELHKRCRESVERLSREGHLWVLEDQGQLVACSGFNTAIAEAVQVGGVYTPHHLRGSGYGRCAVAASLLEVRKEGVRDAILFTGEDNVPAQKAYEALGFRHIGYYRLVLLRNPLTVPLHLPPV